MLVNDLSDDFVARLVTFYENTLTSSPDTKMINSLIVMNLVINPLNTILGRPIIVLFQNRILIV